jgi:hypothetical protein
VQGMVTMDPDEAAAAVARGDRRVLVVAPDAQVATAIPGRLAILVGQTDDPATLAAAVAMERELFASMSEP